VLSPYNNIMTSVCDSLGVEKFMVPCATQSEDEKATLAVYSQSLCREVVMYKHLGLIKCSKICVCFLDKCFFPESRIRERKWERSIFCGLFSTMDLLSPLKHHCLN